jgi:hypothetical protein
MIDKIQLTHKPIIIGDLEYDIIDDYHAINDNIHRLMEFAFGLYVDQNLCLHFNDKHFPTIEHIIKSVPCLYQPDDMFDEESMDNVCTLIEFIQQERKARNGKRDSKID